MIELDRSKIESLLESLKRNTTSGASELIGYALKMIRAQLDLIQDQNMDISKDIYLLLKKLLIQDQLWHL